MAKQAKPWKIIGGKVWQYQLFRSDRFAAHREARNIQWGSIDVNDTIVCLNSKTGTNEVYARPGNK